MNALATLALTAALAGGAPAHEVSMPGQFYAPRELDVLVGESVTWRNADHAAHTVTADDGSFDSGTVAGGGVYTRRFDRPGTYAFHCTVHRFMRGVVRVHELVLRAPAGPVRVASEATLAGQAQRGDVDVVLERDGRAVASTRADAAGAFSFRVAAEPGAAYRARSGTATSGEVRLAVAPRVTIAAERRGDAVVLRVAAEPSRAGALAVVQVYSRERFAWHRAARAAVGADSTATLTLRPRRRVYVRAVVLASAGYADGVSRALVLGGAASRSGGRSASPPGHGHDHAGG